MAVAGIIRQQACGLGVWCPEEEGAGDDEEELEKEEEEGEQEREAPVRTYKCWRLAFTPWFSLTTATSRPSRGCRLMPSPEPVRDHQLPSATGALCLPSLVEDCRGLALGT